MQAIIFKYHKLRHHVRLEKKELAFRKTQLEKEFEVSNSDTRRLQIVNDIHHKMFLNKKLNEDLKTLFREEEAEASSLPEVTEMLRERSCCNISSFQRGQLLGSGSYGSVYVYNMGIYEIAVKEFTYTADWYTECKNYELVGESELFVRKLFVADRKIAMEYSKDSTTLLDLIRTSLLSRPRILHISVHLLNAIQYLQDIGLCFGDFDPTGVLVFADDKVKLVDYGGVTLVGDTTLVRKHLYAEPSWFVDSVVSEYSDVWAFGIMVLNMLGLFPCSSVSSERTGPAEYTLSLLDVIRDDPSSLSDPLVECLFTHIFDRQGQYFSNDDLALMMEKFSTF